MIDINTIKEYLEELIDYLKNSIIITSQMEYVNDELINNLLNSLEDTYNLKIEVNNRLY